MTQQQTERDEALIAEAVRNIDYGEGASDYEKRLGAEILRLERLRGDEPAKPDRYLQAWTEAYVAWGEADTGKAKPQAAAAVLRKHFAPPREVVEAARAVRKWYSGLSNPRLLADFILKGDV